MLWNCHTGSFCARVVLTLMAVLWIGALSAEVNYVEPYFEDDIATITPPESEGLQSFIIPVYGGLLRMGRPYKYEIPIDVRDPDVHRTKPSRNEGVLRKEKGFITYLGLLAFSGDKVNLGSLRDALLGGGTIPDVRYLDGYAQRANNMLYLARALLTDEEYRAYLCSDGVPCPLDKFKTSRPYRAIGYAVTPFWGSAKNDFRVRASYRAFVESYAQHLYKWGDTLTRRIAVVSRADLGSYDFDKGSFLLRVSPAVPMSVEAAATLKGRSTAAYDIAFLNAGQGQFPKIEITLKMPIEDAEALREAYTAASRRHRVPLLAVYEGELTKVAVSSGMTIPRDKLQLDFEHRIAGDRIEFFYGLALKEKAFEVRL